MIKEDSISLALTLGSGFIPIYLSTFIGWPVALQTVSYLLLIGLVFQLYMLGKPIHDPYFSQKEASDTVLYTLLALATFGMASFVMPELFRPPPMSFEGKVLQVQGPLLYGVFFAISEEQFFRGAWLKFAAWKLNKPYLPELLSAGIFTVYHFAVYGTSLDKLTYVAVAGLILAVCVIKSGRLTPALGAHIINNVMV